jgi:hypothetical protein
MASIEVDVDIDVEEYIDEISDDSLITEILNRGIDLEEVYGSSIKDFIVEYINSNTRRILSHSVSDEELIERLKEFL